MTINPRDAANTAAPDMGSLPARGVLLRRALHLSGRMGARSRVPGMLTPKVRRDGRCVVCRKPRPFNPQRGVPWGAYLADPFCSSACAKKHFGTTETSLRKTTHGILQSKEPPERTAPA